jgi:hypothetical protein
MEKTISCPGCNIVFHIQPGMVGKKYRCKSCRTIVSVPSDLFSEDNTRSTPVFKKTTWERPLETEKKSKSRRPIFVFTLITATILIAIAATTYILYNKYQYAQFVESLIPHIKNTSLRVGNISRYEIETGTGVTYRELFDKLEADVTEIDKRVLEIQTVSTSSTQSIINLTAAYLKSSQDYLRSILLKYRKQLALSTAKDLVKKNREQISSASSPFVQEYVKSAVDKAFKDVAKANSDYNESRSAVRVSANKLKLAREGMTPHFPIDALISSEQIDAVVKGNSD